ncbi:MAG: argininosuccinate synthase [Taibaiella sp.]|nr:argininosuccinate synthase [Taibaiella sp.]
MKKKIVLAYSGGLDTTYCAMYLKNAGYDVHAITVQTGGFSTQELNEIGNRAKAIGVSSYKVADVTGNYYHTCLRYLVYGNVLKNNTYPLSVSAERMVQAMAVADYAREIGAEAVAHGSTGAGNDQVRFDMVFHSMLPGVQIITPIRDQKLSRDEEVAYLAQNNVKFDSKKARYSINKGLWGTSVGGKETLTSDQYLPEDAWPTPVTRDEPVDVVLHFVKGELTGIDDQTNISPVAAIQQLQDLAQPFGIGRDIHVGDTIIGIKGRVGFEAAAPLIIIKAHHLLEKHTLTKWQLHWKEQLAGWYGGWLHEGQMLDPVMRNIETFLEDTQTNVTGKVFVTLLPHRFLLKGIDSPHDLMSSRFGAYGEMNNGWTGDDVKGFAKIFGNQVSIFHSVNNATKLTANDDTEN